MIRLLKIRLILFFSYSPICDHVYICFQLLQYLQRMRESLFLRLYLHTQGIVMDDVCIPRIAYIGFMLEKCSFYHDRTTVLTFISRQFAIIAAKNFSHDTIDCNELLLTGVTDCEAALELIKAMEHNNVSKLVLHLDERCMRTLTDIKYPRDRVELYYMNY